MNFVEAVKSVLFYNFHSFSGRAPRSEYWFWVLFSFLCGLVLGFADAAILGPNKTLLSTFFQIFTLLPSIAVGVRRFHDINKSGWWLLIGIIPIVGWIITIVWACTKGTTGDNRFGPDPLAGQSA